MNSGPTHLAFSLGILTFQNVLILARKRQVRISASRRSCGDDYSWNLRWSLSWHRVPMGSDVSSRPLASLLSENRVSRVSIRTVTDVTFPEVVSFPLRQRLTLNGAYKDVTLQAPHVTDEQENWGVVAENDIEE